MGRRVSAARIVRALLALAALGAGCGMLIDGELGAVLCSDEGAVGPPACPIGAMCTGGTCAEPPASGRPCAGDADCRARDICLDPAAFGGTGGPACARTCCTSGDCDPDGGFVCWIPDLGGGGFCRPGAAVGRPSVGARRPGEACAAGGECRSGICGAGVCADACCSDASCAAHGGTCQLTSMLVAAGAAWACRPDGAGKKGHLEDCSEDAECASGLCHEVAGGLRCVAPCCGSGMCAGSVKGPSGPGGGLHDLRCAEISRGGAILRACAAVAPPGGAAVGAPCADDAGCRSRMCVSPPGGGERVCSDVCCDDASCGDASLFACRPYPSGPSWALRCELK